MDASWKSITHVISFKELPMPHTGVAIADWLLQSLVEWKAITKCSFITWDNVLSKNVASPWFQSIVLDRSPSGLEADGKFFHVRCAAHVINLIV
jgi:hypothetical protein